MALSEELAPRVKSAAVGLQRLLRDAEDEDALADVDATLGTLLLVKEDVAAAIKAAKGERDGHVPTRRYRQMALEITLEQIPVEAYA